MRLWGGATIRSCGQRLAWVGEVYVEGVFISWSLVSMDYVCFKLFALYWRKNFLLVLCCWGTYASKEPNTRGPGTRTSE